MTRSRSLLLWLTLLPLSAGALELIPDRLEFNAYGTLGQTRSSLNEPPYHATRLDTYGAGHEWTSVLDNRAGAQLTLHLTPDIDVVGHGLVRRNSLDDTEWQTTWAYARWRPDEHWELSLGRFRQPLFMITEEFDVGYAWPWVRPPVELYSLAGESTYMDGGKLRYLFPLGDYTLALSGFTGSLHINRRPRSEYDTHIRGVEASLSDGNLTLRASALDSDTELDAPRLQNVVDLIATQNPGVARDYAIDQIDHQRYASLGLRYEDGRWLVMAEYVRLWLQTRSLPDKEAYYLTLGHSFGDFTPYATYARQEMADSLSENRLSGVPALAANSLLTASNSEQYSYSLGVRWDFYPGLALKGQVDQVYQRSPSFGLQGAPLPNGREHFTVTSVVLDWAF